MPACPVGKIRVVGKSRSHVRRPRWRGPIVAVAVLALAGLGLTACGGSDGDGAGGSAPSSAAPSASGPVSVRPLGGDGRDVHPVDVVTGLAAPWDVAFLPSGDALISERDSGRILRLPAGGHATTELTQLPDVVHRGESGLLGLAVSPRFATDGLVYAYYTTRTDNRVVRFRLAGDRAEPPTPILTGLADGTNHNGGRIRFGPDGLLYVTVGDAGDRAHSQDRGSLNGKILRMRPDGTVPPDNPFPGSLVYTLGHRNVQGLAWDSAGRLWASEFGQDTYDEINLIKPGHNYGWPVVEGVGDTHGGQFTNPLVTWPVAEASPSGIAIRGDTLYVAGLRGTRLWEVDLAGERVDGKPRAILTGQLGRLRAAMTTPDGSLWILTNNTDSRGQPRPGDDRIVSLT